MGTDKPGASLLLPLSPAGSIQPQKEVLARNNKTGNNICGALHTMKRQASVYKGDNEGKKSVVICKHMLKIAEFSCLLPFSFIIDRGLSFHGRYRTMYTDATKLLLWLNSTGGGEKAGLLFSLACLLQG